VTDICEPRATIIMVRYRQPEMENRCIESVKRHTDLNVHRFLVADNSKTDKNLGALWNDLIAGVTTTYVMLLNSDTVVEPGWLDKLIATAEETGADAVGPMTDKCGIAFQMGHVTKSKAIRSVPTLSGFCVLIRRSSWHRAGGFREDFPFYGQESNLMDRFNLKVLRRDVFVHHEAGGSLLAEGRAEERGYTDVYLKNREIDWHGTRLLVIGSSPNNEFPLWRGIDQAMVEFGRQGMYCRHVPIDEPQDWLEHDPTHVIMVTNKHVHVGRLKAYIDRLPGLKALWFNDLRTGHDKGIMAGIFHQVFLCWRDQKGKGR